MEEPAKKPDEAPTKEEEPTKKEEEAKTEVVPASAPVEAPAPPPVEPETKAGTTEEDKAAAKAATTVQSRVRGHLARKPTAVEKKADGAEQAVITEDGFKESMKLSGDTRTDEELSADFKRLDKDGSGGLSLEELEKAKAELEKAKPKEAAEAPAAAPADGDAAAAPAAAAPPPPAKTSLEDMMAMLNMASASSQQANDAADKAREQTDAADKKLVRGRRKSRELEETAFSGMTMAEVNKIKSKFEEIDTDGSGTIDETELTAALKKVGKTNVSDKHIKAIINKYCSNEAGEKALSFADFQKLFAKWDEELAEIDDEAARLAKALEDAAPQTDGRRKSVQDPGLSRSDSKETVSRNRSRRTSKDDLTTPKKVAAGAGAAAAKELRTSHE